MEQRGNEALVAAAVRAALGTGTLPPACDPIGLDTIELAGAVGVLEQVLAVAHVVGLEPEARRVATAVLRANALRGSQAEAMAWRVGRLLADAGIPSLALKGVALAAMTGRTAAERPGVDTDVLIAPSDWPAAHRALVAANFAPPPRLPAPRQHDSLTRFLTFTCDEAAYRGPIGGPVDLHWRLGPGHLPSLAAPALFARSVYVAVAGDMLATLDPDAMLAHVALHGAKDRWRSLRTLVDAYLLVTKGGATWEGASALAGRSSAVRTARAAVDAVIIDGAPLPMAQLRASEDEPLRSYVIRRAALTPSVASTAAVAAKALLPPQLLAGSRVPRRLWWLELAPRSAHAVAVIARTAKAREPVLRRYWGHAAAVSRDLTRGHRGAPSQPRTYRVLRTVHVRTAGASSRTLRTLARQVPGGKDQVSREAVLHARARAGGSLDELRRRGLTVVDPVLDAAALARLRGFAEHAPARIRLADGRVVHGTYAERLPDAVAVHLVGAFAWANAEVQRVMAATPLHDLALARFGIAPVVHTPSLYWSCVPTGGSTALMDDALARTFHIDYDGVGSIRVHVYLTDVDEDGAPMQYVIGSHRVGSIHGKQFRTADVGLDESFVTERFGTSAIRTITGPAGTTFVSDPFGLHRATRPRTHDRLFLIVPIQAGALSGYVNRRRAVPVRDAHFGEVLNVPGGALRLFTALEDGDANPGAPRAAQLVE